MTEDKKRKIHEKEIDADARSARWLADGNEAFEKGDKATAERCYEKAQFWLDRANRRRVDLFKFV